MRYQMASIGFALAVVGVMACGDNSQPSLPGPRMQAAAPSSALTCNFRTLSQLATHYFSGPEAKVVRGLIGDMQTAGAFTATAQNRGFDVMTHIAANITAGNADATDASSLTNGLLACMYNNPADLPATFPEDFSIPTTPALHGAYAVRGGATDPDTAVVFSRPLASPFSGIAPPGAATCVGCLGSTTWPVMLGGTRALVYGLPGSTSKTYDWRIVPRSATFTPPAVVGVCVDPFAQTTSLVHEQNVGLLPFVNALFMNLGTCSPVATASTAGPLQFARGIVRRGLDLFGPRTLSASGSVFIDGLGGTTGGIHSEFGEEKTDTVTVTFTVQPSDVRVNQIIAPPVVIQATHASTGAAVANVSISLAAFNNNGTPAVLLGTLTQVTNAAGFATFADLSETKTGGYLLTASGSVGGRPAIFVLPVSSTRFNVRP